MSRTDKDRPAWVVNFEHGRIDHDHTRGVCRVETAAQAKAAATSRRRWHGRVCTKYTVVEFTCTKASPHPASPRWHRWGAESDRPCWSSWVEFLRDDDGTVYDARTRSQGCTGHTRRVYTPDAVCVCDDFEPPATCTPAWEFGTHYAVMSPPKWYRDHTWTNPERRRERDGLRDLAREYNAYGDLADGDFVNTQHRNGASWAWE